MKGAMIMPLSYVGIGETRTISAFQGKDDVKRHLQDIGFVAGEKVRVLSENESGLILLVKDARIALNKGLAARIMVN